ncbi:MAG: NUDIX hydrolase [Microthrixaceae bacterium]|nr:NUDIX hydrolase [Microthrixaceae bacterium]MCO5312749.1 NUDIX hydrolase [Microthrixaceae bacterium]
MAWINHGERELYSSPWVTLGLADVEWPDGTRFDHHLIRCQPAAGCIVIDPERGVLLLWRHRFITDTWGWEIPAGRVDEGESIVDAARRETLEETGWEPEGLTPLVDFYPSNGLSDQHFHVFVATGATHRGEPSDPNEADRVEWVSVEDLREALRRGEMNEGLSVTACCYALAFGAFGDLDA